MNDIKRQMSLIRLSLRPCRYLYLTAAGADLLLVLSVYSARGMETGDRYMLLSQFMQIIMPFGALLCGIAFLVIPQDPFMHEALASCGARIRLLYGLLLVMILYGAVLVPPAVYLAMEGGIPRGDYIHIVIESLYLLSMLYMVSMISGNTLTGGMVPLIYLIFSVLYYRNSDIGRYTMIRIFQEPGMYRAGDDAAFLVQAVLFFMAGEIWGRKHISCALSTSFRGQ